MTFTNDNLIKMSMIKQHKSETKDWEYKHILITSKEIHRVQLITFKPNYTTRHWNTNLDEGWRIVTPKSSNRHFSQKGKFSTLKIRFTSERLKKDYLKHHILATLDGGSLKQNCTTCWSLEVHSNQQKWSLA